MEHLGHLQDDEVLGIGGRCHHAAGHHLGNVVPGFPDYFGVGGFVQVGDGDVTPYSLELIVTGSRDDVAVGVTVGVQVDHVRGERIHVVLQFVGDVADFRHGATGNLQGIVVLVNLDIFSVLHELQGEAALHGSTVGQIDKDLGAVHRAGELQQRFSLVLGEDLLLVGDLHLQELVTQGFLLGRGQEVTLIVAFHFHAQDTQNVLELEGITLVARSHNLLAGGGELAVEEAVGQIVHSLGGIGSVEVAGAVVASVGLEAVYGLGSGLAVDVACFQRYHNLVLGVLAVHHNLVAGHPGFLGAVFRQYKGEGVGFRSHFLFLGKRVIGCGRDDFSLITRGKDRQNAAKNGYFV